ncbi:heme-binding protein [Clostridium chauvoei]|uniref:GlcG/HbpS family heme-binding protein n=1 Tax=Clostridium chauvoei TaxID=46867 RepID=UPI001C851F8E|nr:heme-binding protein [Clostridium chauvoei]MBX7422513.1 heme-binding protein [Clostridium chauvoei]
MSNCNYLNLKIVTTIIERIEIKAKELGTPVVITICNDWGYPIAVHVMDGALPVSFDISVNKAFTSATTRLSTKELRNLSKDDGDLFGIINTNDNKIIAFPGGFPLIVNGKVIGAIGISGGTSDYDNKLAFLGKLICEEVIECLAMKSQ